MTAETLSISICIPTCQRPRFLGDLLTALARQTWIPAGTEVLVADDDPAGSARPVVAGFRDRLKITYLHEPRRNIAAARNLLAGHAANDVVVFLDDDQLVPADFLASLGRAWPALPPHTGVGVFRRDFVYEPDVPPGLAALRLYDREPPAAGPVSLARVATSGVAIRREVFTSAGLRFDPQWGQTGGEDTLFFRTYAQAGGRGHLLSGVVCQERLTGERATIAGYVARQRHEGMVHSRLERHFRGFSGWVRYLAGLAPALGAAAGLYAVSCLRGPRRQALARGLLARQIGKIIGAFRPPATVYLTGGPQARSG